MLQLSNVTLLTVSTRDVELAVEALVKSTSGITFGAIKLISHYRPENLPDFIRWEQVHEMADIDEWNNYIFYHLWKHVDTEFGLLVHPDGYVVHPEQWRDEFLNYDYIGAPWPISENLRDSIGEYIRVGNSVSIRSRRLMKLPLDAAIPWRKFHDNYNEDSQICVYNRHYFTDVGMTFAPIEVARYFSHEIPLPETEGITPFAFHAYEPPFPPFSMTDVYSSYINLDSRPDRNDRMITELQKTGLPVNRTTGLLPEEVALPFDKIAIMHNRTPGAIGCHYSQVAVMEEALKRDQHALVMEDDLVFCNDFQNRLKIIEEFLSNHDWDIFWLGGTYHVPAKWHDAAHSNPDLRNCTCTLNADAQMTDDERIVRTYGCWSTYGYIVNRKRIAHILDLLDQNVYQSMGIDWLFIKLQPELLTYAFVPGCVKQYDNQSNIGKGVTRFSTFEKLGPHWYQDNADNFDYETFYKTLNQC